MWEVQGSEVQRLNPEPRTLNPEPKIEGGLIAWVWRDGGGDFKFLILDFRFWIGER